MTRVAVIHDWLTGMRGGEYVLEGILELYPEAELFTLLHVPGTTCPTIENRKIHTSALQKIPGIERRYRHFLPWMPFLIEQFDLTGFDLILSSSHCVAKGIRKPPGSKHISYMYTPMRYIWDRFDEYFGPGQASPLVRAAAHLIRKPLQNWDRRTSSAERIDLLIGDSHFIAQRIQKAYGREAKVIYPYVDFSRFTAPRTPGKDYLMVSAFAPYKKVDLAIEAFNQLGLPLVIVGSGQDEEKLKAMAGPTIRFLGPVSNPEIAELFSQCQAFVFPGVEDFGITPVEAMAAGAPIIALREGGAAETVTEKTGVFFYPQIVEALKTAVRDFESGKCVITEADCRARASYFTKERFHQELQEAIQAIQA